MLTDEEFRRIINGFAGMGLPFAPDFKDPVVFNVWYKELKNLSRDDFVKIYKIVIKKKWDRFPQIAELVECLNGDLSHMTALAWARVLKLMGNTYKPIAVDEITARALREILPHSNIHDVSSGWDEDTIQWRKKEFEEAFKTCYEITRLGHFAGHELPSLSGARGKVPIFKVPSEDLRDQRFLEPTYSEGVKELSAGEEFKMPPQLLQAITEIKPEPQASKPKRGGLKEHLAEVMRNLEKQKARAV